MIIFYSVSNNFVEVNVMSFEFGNLQINSIFKFVSDARNGPARGWRLCEFICEPTLHFSGVFSLPIAFQDKLSLFETKLISCHGFSNSRYFAKKFRISATQKKSEHIYNSHQFEHLSHVFETILFRSMFINKGFLVILRVSTFF